MAYADVVKSDYPIGYWRLNDPGGSPLSALAGGPALGPSGITYNVMPLLVGDDSKHLFCAGSLSTSGISSKIPTGNNPLSCEIWMQLSATGSTRGLWGVNNTSAGNSNWYLTQTTTQLDLVPWGNDLFVSVTTDNLAHHIAGVWDGTTMILYLDGKVIGTRNPGALSIPSNPPLLVGNANVIAGTANTVIGEFAIYAYALSPSRVRAHYLAGKGLGYGVGATQRDRRRR